MKLGVVKGLAYKHDYLNWAEEARKEEILNEQAAQRKSAHAKEIADNIQFGKTYTQYDQNDFNKYSTGLIKDLGDYAIQNPDWETNFEKRLVVQQKKDQFLNNPITQRAARVQQSRALMLKDLSDPDLADSDEVKNKLLEYDNYDKNGGKEFSYQTPVLFDPVEHFSKVGKSIQTNPVSWDKGDYYGISAKANDKDLRRAAEQDFSGVNGSRLQRAYEREVKQYGQEFASPIDWHMANTKKYVNQDLSIQHKPSANGGASAGDPFSPFATYLAPKMAKTGTAFDKNIGEFLPIVNGQMAVKPSQGLLVQGSDGRMIKLSNYNNDYVDAEPTGDIQTFGSGRTYAKVKTTVEYRPELNGVGIPDVNGKRKRMFTIPVESTDGNELFKQGGESGTAKPGRYGEEISDDLKQAVYFEIDGEGKRTGRLVLNSWVLINPQGEQKQSYDAKSGGSLNALKVAKSDGQPVPADDFDSKWATLKSGQSLTGPDGKLYTKK